MSAAADEEAMIGRLLHERNGHREAARRRRQRGEPRVVEAHRDLGREVLEQVAREAELGKDDELRATPIGPRR